MKRTHLTRTFAAALLASATFSVPALANSQAYHNGNALYDDCKRSDTNNQVIGGLLGAVAGGVIGSQIAGRGDRKEGTVIGGVLGSVAGVGIGNDQRHCTQEAIQTSAGQGYNPGPVVSGGSVHNSGVTYGSGQTYGSNQTYNGPTTYNGSSSTTYTHAPVHTQSQARTVYTSPHIATPTYTTPTYSSPTYSAPVSSDVVYAGTTTVYGNSPNQGFDRFDNRSSLKSAKLSHKKLKKQRLKAIDYEIDALIDQRCILEEKFRYNYSSPRIARKIQDIDYQIGLLKQERRDLRRNRIVGY